MTCPTGGAPNINYGKNNYGKNNYGKNGQSLISQEKSIMEKMELWKKKGSDHFRDILNPYGEKPNYGKIGRRRRLSKLNVFFFHNSVGCHRTQSKQLIKRQITCLHLVWGCCHGGYIQMILYGFAGQLIRL